MRYLVLLSLLVGIFGGGFAVAQERFAVSADGLEVTDSKTNLLWRRCPEGMTWKLKACKGEAIFFTQGEAAGRAEATGAAVAQWRLPTMRELSTIASAREAQDGKAAINPTAFPGTPAARFWTSNTTGPGYFTFVSFSDGSAGEGPRTSPGAVRLVRASK